MKNYTKKTIDFYNKNTDVYIKSGAVVLKNKINKFTKLVPGNKILDVACGPGHDTDYLTKKGFNCLGIDLSKKMTSFAKKNYLGKFKVTDFLNLRFKRESFAGIWCSSALVHVDKKDINRVLKKFSKILKGGGILGIITPAYQKRIKRETDTRIFTMFNKAELKKHLLNNGFKIIKLELFSFSKMRWIFAISKKIKE